jgi:hypothetical protein
MVESSLSAASDSYCIDMCNNKHPFVFEVPDRKNNKTANTPTQSMHDSPLEQNESSHHSPLACEDKDNDLPLSTPRGEDGNLLEGSLFEGKHSNLPSLYVTEDNECSSIGSFLIADKSPLKPKRRVSFHNIEIQEYPIIPGDNPAVTMGVPLTIDWEPLLKISLRVDEYEKKRPSRSRSMVELRMPMARRYQVLHSLQFSRREILRYAKQATVIRNSRKRTNSTLHLEPMQELMEQWSKILGNVTWNRVENDKEKEWMKRYQYDNPERGDKKGDVKNPFAPVCVTKLYVRESSRGSEIETLSSPKRYESSVRTANTTTASTTTSKRSSKGLEDDRTTLHKNKMTTSKSNKKQKAPEQRGTKEQERRLKRRHNHGPKIPNSIKKKQEGERLPSHRVKPKTLDSVEVWSKSGAKESDTT